MSVSEPRKHIRDAFLGLSRTAQAVLGYVTLAGLHSADGAVPIAEIKGALGLTEDQWQRAADELYEEGVAYPFASDERVLTAPADAYQSNLTSEVARFAIGAAGRPSAKDWARIRGEVFAYHFSHIRPHCLACKVETDDLALDHLQPVSRGGSNHFLNFMPLCKSCNSSKGVKTWPEWRAGK